MPADYAGKVSLVTGGNSGIGRELVRLLASENAKIVVWGRNPETGASLAEEISKNGGEIQFAVVDVRHSGEVESALNNIMRQYGRLDYVFHGAGIILAGEFRDSAIEEISEIMQTNALGSAYVAYYAYRLMAQQGYGHLVLMSSGAGIFPVPVLGIYSASKFAVSGLGEVLRLEGRALGVRVSTVVPGLVDTPIYERAMYDRTDKAKSLSLLKKRWFVIQPDQAARRILLGTAKNRAVIHTHFYVRLSWLAYRLMPWLFLFFLQQLLRVFRLDYRK